MGALDRIAELHQCNFESGRMCVECRRPHPCPTRLLSIAAANEHAADVHVMSGASLTAVERMRPERDAARADAERLAHVLRLFPHLRHDKAVGAALTAHDALTAEETQ